MIWFEFRCLHISDFKSACCWWCITCLNSFVAFCWAEFSYQGVFRISSVQSLLARQRLPFKQARSHSQETSPAVPHAAKPDIWISAHADSGGDFSKKRRASDPVHSSCRSATFKTIYYANYNNYLLFFQVCQDHLCAPRLSRFSFRILQTLIPCGGGGVWPRFFNECQAE